MATRTEPWIERKRRYLAHLPAVEDDATLRVALADKVHNARSIVRDYREEGQALWTRFPHRSAREQLWYYSGLVEFFERRRPGPLTEDLWRAVGELAWLVARDRRSTATTRCGLIPTFTMVKHLRAGYRCEVAMRRFSYCRPSRCSPCRSMMRRRLTGSSTG